MSPEYPTPEYKKPSQPDIDRFNEARNSLKERSEKYTPETEEGLRKNEVLLNGGDIYSILDVLEKTAPDKNNPESNPIVYNDAFSALTILLPKEKHHLLKSFEPSMSSDNYESGQDRKRAIELIRSNLY
jgi:hypothetical protein